MRRSRVRCCVLAGAVVVVVAGCRPGLRRPVRPADTDRLAALLLNGGGTPASNYWSHVEHLRRMYRALRNAGVPGQRIWVLASDGQDPAPDLAQRAADRTRDAWLLAGSRLDGLLRPPIETVDSKLPGVTLGRADRAGVEAWFRLAGGKLVAGDTLLLFVTDHGTRNRRDPADNRITLWGDNESLSVRELAALVERHVAPGVRVLTIMAQCYSGGFAHLAPLEPEAATERPMCGYFSTTATRPAYGCYPEAAEDGDRGHAMRIIDAAARLGGLPEAHEAVLVWDDTPDVPIRTSDVYLEARLRARAEQAGEPFAAFVDAELARALERPKRWEPLLRLLDDVAAHYGLFSPRRLAELDARATTLESMAETFRRQREAWRAARASAANAGLARWLASAGDDWRRQLRPAAIAALRPAGRAQLRDATIAQFARAAERDGNTLARLRRLRDTTERAEDVTFRTEVRAAVLLRLRYLLLRLAGESLLEREGTPAERRRLADLVACETLRLAPEVRPRTAVAAPKPPLPSVAEDEAAARDILPSWLGVKFQRPPESLAAEPALTPGAAFVAAVFDGSPAAAAGIRPGDLILGPPDAPFREPGELREWTMFHPRAVPAPLRLFRDGRPRDVTVRLAPFPTAFPSLPAPPAVGDPAPPLSLSAYRGTPPPRLASGHRTLLFFWATWCGVCKAALPALEDLAQREGLDIVAITDETSAKLDSFFAAHRGFFPATVARDPSRATFLAYGVNGMPTFVMVGPKGRIVAHHVGYDRRVGLPF